MDDGDLVVLAKMEAGEARLMVDLLERREIRAAAAVVGSDGSGSDFRPVDAEVAMCLAVAASNAPAPKPARPVLAY
jgi:hypothetical protein